MTGFIDSNILLYAALQSDEDAAKRERAWALLDGGDCALSLQVLQEFVVQATRQSRADRIELEEAIAYVAVWRRFPVQETTLALLDAGLRIQQRHRFSFWNSMVIAAAVAQGCAVLWTEDMQDGRIVEGVRIANPFRTD